MHTKRLQKELKKLNPNLLLFEYPMGRYALYGIPRNVPRPPEKLETCSFLKRLAAGHLIFLMEVPTPGMWLIDYLSNRDPAKIDVMQVLREVTEHNERLARKSEELASDVLKEAVKSSWRHVVDELRGDTVRRNYTLVKP